MLLSAWFEYCSWYEFMVVPLTTLVPLQLCQIEDLT